MEWNALVPELVVASYAASKAFYLDVFGFSLRFERAENNFGYFDLGGAQIMLLQDIDLPVYRMQRSGPKGKGLHFQVEVPSISGILERLDRASVPLAAPVVESWYRQEAILHGQREFFVSDPDGYLFRFYEYLGERSVPNRSVSNGVGGEDVHVSFC
ncbi:MAG TPA: VOC family protein [Povalibacter sp.]|uniref:VOC family protein n=1 Tax=Povalibacter sp. TaxID=1962978 RepID=UPI002BA5AED0|nr:VOC family protein [Povalibacter sp.]HMN44574.1 VOC family protein [Povalibacter sp.]